MRLFHQLTVCNLRVLSAAGVGTNDEFCAEGFCYFARFFDVFISDDIDHRHTDLIPLFHTLASEFEHGVKGFARKNISGDFVILLAVRVVERYRYNVNTRADFLRSRSAVNQVGQSVCVEP